MLSIEVIGSFWHPVIDKSVNYENNHIQASVYAKLVFVIHKFVYAAELASQARKNTGCEKSRTKSLCMQHKSV